MMTVPDGCFACMRDEGEAMLYRARIEPREPIAAVGAGDAFLAGYVAARYGGEQPPACLRFAVACGAESTQRLGAGLVDPGRVERFVAETEVERVAAPAEVT
jgi:sugar/nucleoside kinase (ribokinase family)